MMSHYIGIHRTIFSVMLLLLCSAAQLSAADVSLAWDASTSQNIAGYKVYVGTAAGTYSTSTTIGNQTTYTVTGLSAGKYYFAVKAFNTSGAESAYSNEVSTTIAGSSITCDLNGDGGINAIDLQRMVNIILGIASSSSSYDLNTDGKVDVLDLQILNNVVLGLRSCSL
jgi:predicted phage tail protein